MTFLSLIAAPELSEETVPKLLGIANLLKVLLSKKDGVYLLLRIRSTHLEIFGCPMGGAY